MLITKQINIAYRIIITTLLIAAMLIIGYFARGVYHRCVYPYVAGKTGTRCYRSGYEHGNIKYHIYFKTLEECENYVKIKH